MNLNGTFTALVTPFTSSGEIDDTTLQKLVEQQISSGINGLVPVGTTGESPTLTNSEHHEVIKLVVNSAQGRVPIIAGCGSNNTSEALNHTKAAKDLGAKASLHVAGYYNKPSASGFLRHFFLIADTVDLPLIVYNIPGRTGKNIDNNTMLKLAEHPNIVGVKEASGNYTQIMDLINKKPDDFAVLSGDDEATFPIITLGGNGVISVTSNLLPKEMVKLVDLSLSGQTTEARKQHYKLLPLITALMSIDTNPIPIKAALHLSGTIEENYRLPMTPLTSTEKEKLVTILQEFGII